MPLILLCVAVLIILLSLGMGWPVSLLFTISAFISWRFHGAWWMLPAGGLVLFLIFTGWMGVAIILGIVALLWLGNRTIKSSKS